MFWFKQVFWRNQTFLLPLAVVIQHKNPAKMATLSVSKDINVVLRVNGVVVMQTGIVSFVVVNGHHQQAHLVFLVQSFHLLLFAATQRKNRASMAILSAPMAGKSRKVDEDV
jgi:hypothetical protein